MEKSYRLLGYILLALIPLTFIGFYKTYFVHFFNFRDSIETLVHVHAFIASMWILTLIIQPILILNKKNKIHKTIGKISYLLFPLLILSFIPQMINKINSDDVKSLYFSIADSFLLITFYSLAIRNRKTVSKHMRYMITIALVFIFPTFGRISGNLLGWSNLLGQNVSYGIIFIVLIGLIYYDRSKKRKYSPYLLAIVFFVMHQIGFHIVFI